MFEIPIIAPLAAVKKLWKVSEKQSQDSKKRPYKPPAAETTSEKSDDQVFPHIDEQV